ncbi:MAG: DUF3598 family protein [Cyanobacteria bacterium P01_C01_bin.118]
MNKLLDTNLEHLWTTDQWTYIRKNIGEWQGAFIQFSPSAAWVSSTSSVLTLEEDRPGEHMTLVLKRTSPGKPTHTMERDLGYPGAAPYICFFPTGAFSQGAMQRRPWSSFGSEFSLLADNQRRRLVQLYSGTASGDHTLDYVTLIPEHRSGAVGIHQTSSTPAVIDVDDMTTRLGLETVRGRWQGTGLILSANMESPQLKTIQWQARCDGGDLMVLEDGQEQRFVAIDSHRWQGLESAVQFWLLPGDVSCTVYPQLPRQHGARLEFCWYLSAQQRQRIVREYGADGGWGSTSLMVETRV